MFDFKCQYTRARLSAFLSRELASEDRSYVARHLDECEVCYAEYRRLREDAHELERSLPRLGTLEGGRLNSLWAQIQTQIAPAPASLPQSAEEEEPFWRYVLVAGVVLVTVLVSMMLEAHSVRHLPLERPAPYSQASQVQETPEQAVRVSVQRSVETVFVRYALTPPSQAYVTYLRNTPDPVLLVGR